jgi:hypothetical protein
MNERAWCSRANALKAENLGQGSGVLFVLECVTFNRKNPASLLALKSLISGSEKRFR